MARTTEASRRRRPPVRLSSGGSRDQEAPLTSRQREILGCFAEGLSTDSIARRLSISRVTVRNHTQQILARLGVHSRLAAVARAHRDGLVGGNSQTSAPDDRKDAEIEGAGRPAARRGEELFDRRASEAGGAGRNVRRSEER